MDTGCLFVRINCFETVLSASCAPPRSTLSSSFSRRHREKRRDTHSVCVACRETGRRARKKKPAETATKQRTEPDKRNDVPRAARREDQPEKVMDCRAPGIGLSFVRHASEIPATKFVLNLLHGRHVRKQTFSCVALVVGALVVGTLAVTTLTVAALGSQLQT